MANCRFVLRTQLKRGASPREKKRKRKRQKSLITAGSWQKGQRVALMKLLTLSTKRHRERRGRRRSGQVQREYASELAPGNLCHVHSFTQSSSETASLESE